MIADKDVLVRYVKTEIKSEDISEPAFCKWMSDKYSMCVNTNCIMYGNMCDSIPIQPLCEWYEPGQNI